MNQQANRPASSPPLQADVEERFGVLPNFFRLAPEAPEVTENLWGFARFGYLDNPLPPLLKERLFVYLSRFCDVRYCIARHVGFLIGLGRPSGDLQCAPETIEQVVRLIRRPLPRGDELEPHLALLAALESPLPHAPEPDTPHEEAVFACAAHVFLQTPKAARCLELLRLAFDGANLQHLLVFLAFVRTAHFWTKVHPELKLEDDVTQLLSVHEALTECVQNDPEAAGCETTQGLLDELAALRRERALWQQVERANQALRESEAQFIQLADAIPQLAWMARPDGYIDWYNNRWYEYTGTTFEQMEGWGWRSVHDPDVLPQVVERWKASLVSGEPFDMVFPLRGADGVFRPFLTRVMPFRDENGDITRWFGTNTDISEQQQIQEELKEAAARLSEADRRKNEFLATLAHELRNPLAPIRTGLEAMKLAKDDRATIEKIRSTMERQTQQLIALVDDLLDVSRITRGKLELRKCRVELADVVQSAVEASRPFIDEAGHQLTVALPEAPVRLDADPHRLAQVLSNLLQNAAKYTPEGGRIGITAQRLGSDAAISVRDNGVGIPADMQQRIFEMFAQVERPMEKAYTGLGIGLTLVKSLVEMHGGSVEVRSDGPNRGSEFTVRLPVLTAGPETTAGQPDSRAPGASKRRVLVVDDNKAAADMLSMVVRMLGNEVCTAGDGHEAIRVAAEFLPDVILMDLGMPKMSGYDAARHIRQQPWSGNMVLVALTGWGQDEDKRRTREAGFNHHLVKPAEPAELQRLLAESDDRSKQ